jgi:hypothetical protein
VNFPLFLALIAVVGNVCYKLKGGIVLLSFALIFSIASYTGNANISSGAASNRREMLDFISMDMEAHPQVKSAILQIDSALAGNLDSDLAKYYGHPGLATYTPENPQDLVYVFNPAYMHNGFEMYEDLRKSGLSASDVLVYRVSDDAIVLKKYLKLP